MEPLPEDLDSRIQSELREREKLIWAGQPRPGRFMRAAIPIVLFGIPWTAFSIFWVVAASGMLFGGLAAGGPGFGGLLACFPLFGLPFVLIGLGMLSSPWWLRRQARRTCYALTDQRAIVWAAGWFGSSVVRSFTAAELGKMARRDYADGSGDLIFDEFVSFTRDSDGHFRSRQNERGFLGIDNVREVEELVRRTLLKT